LAQVSEEEREPGTETPPRARADAADDIFGELLARQAAAVERVPHRFANLLHLLAADWRVDRPCGVAPCLKLLLGRRARPSPTGGVPDRQFPGGVQVQGAAQRPCLDEHAALPQGRADVRLRDVRHPCAKLQLRGGLYLRVHAAHRACDLDQALWPSARHQR
jgi:hypothetical protein